jgi:hypothetical protein
LPAYDGAGPNLRTPDLTEYERPSVNDLLQAQAELRYSYLRGGPGAFVSGLVWLAASVATEARGVATGFAVLFLGGMTIFPLGTLLVRGVFRRPSPSKGNPGPRMVIETVFPMIGCLLGAWLLIPHRPDLVFPVAAIAVGSHYFGFRTAYGDSTYWVLAASMCAVGGAAIFTRSVSGGAVAWIIAAIETGFGVWFTVVGLRNPGQDRVG